jgi:hypothetical protein
VYPVATIISQKRYPLFSSDHNFFLHEVPQSNDKTTDMHDLGMLDIIVLFINDKATDMHDLGMLDIIVLFINDKATDMLDLGMLDIIVLFINDL